MARLFGMPRILTLTAIRYGIHCRVCDGMGVWAACPQAVTNINLGGGLRASRPETQGPIHHLRDGWRSIMPEPKPPETKIEGRALDLYRIARAMNAAEDLNGILGALLRTTAEEMGLRACSIRLI